MTLVELQDVLGRRIEIAENPDMDIAQRKEETEISQTIASLAKHMFELFDHGFQYANWCPNCGAKMDVGADND